MTDHHLLSATRRPAAPPARVDDTSALEVRMKVAAQVSAARDAVPSAYRQNPGAVLLAQEWAAARGVDLLTTLQTVSFVGGRPVIDATMQRALALRAGYEARVVEVTNDQAKVEIRRGTEVIGTSTYTREDADIAGLLRKDNWKQNPKAMLVARATTQGMRWYAPDVMVGVFAEDEDPTDLLVPLEAPEVVIDEAGLAAAAAHAEEAAAAAAPPADNEPVDAEVVEPAESTLQLVPDLPAAEEPAPEEPPATEEQKPVKRTRKAPAKKAAPAKAAAPPPAEEARGCSDETWAKVSAFGQALSADDRQALRRWIFAQGWELRQDKLSEDAAAKVLEWTP